MKLFLDAVVKSVKEGESDGLFEVIASSGKVDRLGDTIDPKGWYLTNYKKNPVMLWAHDQWQPPIAKADKIWVEGEKELMIKGHFADTQFAQEIKELVTGGFLNAVSVGFMPLVEDKRGNIEIENKMYRHATDIEIKDYQEKGFYREEGNHFTKQELLEVSWVNVPALASALMTSKKMNLALATKALEEISKEDGSLAKKEEGEKEDEKKNFEKRLSDIESAITALRESNPSKTVSLNDSKGRKQNVKQKSTSERLLIMFDKFCELLLKELRQ